MRITKKLLEEWDACKDDIKVFAKVFPRGTTITEASLKKAAKANLDIDWLVTNGFGIKSDNYVKRTRPYFNAWEIKIQPARDRYQKSANRLMVKGCYRLGSSALWKKVDATFERAIRKPSIEYYLKILLIVHRYLKKAGYTDD